MVQSMTGYGASSVSSENYKVSVELKSLNSKYIEINLKLPRPYLKQEVALRNYLTSQLSRGKVNALVNVEVLNADKHKVHINNDLVRAYSKELNSLRSEMNISSEVSLEYILSLPDIMNNENYEEDPEEWNLIELSFQNAAQELIESRIREGKALERDLRIRADQILQFIKDINNMLPARIETIRSRVLSSLNEVKDRFSIDANRFEQELIYYIEKLDINEEMVRLRKHVDYFHQTLNEEISNGKKLGFIAQEMGREINTIGSKANDAEIQIFVVKMKEELEKIKEQVQNIV